MCIYISNLHLYNHPLSIYVDVCIHPSIHSCIHFFNQDLYIYPLHIRVIYLSIYPFIINISTSLTIIDISIYYLSVYRHVCISLSIHYYLFFLIYVSIFPSSIYLMYVWIYLSIFNLLISIHPAIYPPIIHLFISMYVSIYPSLIYLFISMYPLIYPSIIQAPIYLIYTHPDPLPQSIYIHLSNHPPWKYPPIQLIDTNPSLHPAFLCPSTIYTSICASIYPSIYERMKAWRSLDAPPLSSVAQSNSHMLRFSL